MYIPKNKIITNLYTNGEGIGDPDGSDNDFIRSPLYIKDTNNIYKGYYWKDYKGKYYTGKNPNDKPTQELVFLKSDPINENTSLRFETTLNNSPSNYPFPGEEETTLWVPSMPQEYINILNPNSIQEPLNKNLPTQCYPNPSSQNYKLGSFRRYFCVKANEDIWLEINDKTYKALKTKNKKWRWDLYIPFILDWVLVGDQNEVEKANSNSTNNIQKNLKRRGFQRFLKYNYLKFYQTPSKESKIAVPPRPSNNPTVNNSKKY